MVDRYLNSHKYLTLVRLIQTREFIRHKHLFGSPYCATT